MKKNICSLTALCVYEGIKVLFILAARAPYPAEMLPLSWYAAVPFLSFPCIFAFLFFSAADTDAKMRYGTFLSLVHILSVISFSAYIVAALPGALKSGRLQEYYQAKLICAAAFFLVIDAVLGFVFHIAAQKADTENDRIRTDISPDTENNDTEGTLCK